jgi:glutamate synthase domain-containing protein 2
MKIMSKMGISTLRSYRNAQVFEAVGLSQGCWTAISRGRRRGWGASGSTRSRRRRWRASRWRQAPAEAPAAGGRPVRVAGRRRAAPVDGAEHQRLLQQPRARRLGAVQEIRGDDQRPGREAEHAARAVPIKPAGPAVPLEEVEPEASDHAPLHDGRDELRVAGQGGARDAGDRDEPHRRAQQQRRGRGGSGALRRGPTAKTAAARSSRSPAGASA